MYEGPLRTNVKSVKTSILVLKVIQGHCFRCQSKPVYDFLLVINCNLGPISHRFRDMASYWFKISKFSYPLSCRVLDWGDPYVFFGKALQILKLESLAQPMVNIWWSKLAPFLPDPPVWRTDRLGPNCQTVAGEWLGSGAVSADLRW